MICALLMGRAGPPGRVSRRAMPPGFEQFRAGRGHDARRTRLSERECYSRYFEYVKSCAFWGTWQLKHCFTVSVAIGFVGSPPAHAWNPQPPVDAYFLESLTMRVTALRAAP